MLEPDTTPISSSAFPSSRSPPGGAAGVGSQKKRTSTTNASRERNAFLFGEVTSEVSTHEAAERKLSEDEIFGLQPMRKSR